MVRVLRLSSSDRNHELIRHQGYILAHMLYKFELGVGIGTTAMGLKKGLIYSTN